MPLKIRALIGSVALVALAACATEPVAVSHQIVTQDTKHWAVQVSMTTGVPGTPMQTVMLIYNKYSKQPQAIVSGNSVRLGDKLLDAVLALGPALVTGKYIIEAAKIDCPPGALCGTLVQVQNTAGAEAGATATASDTNS